MFELRGDEPKYAFVSEDSGPEVNCYGDEIQLGHKHGSSLDEALIINNVVSIGTGENRFRQHGFYFNADNCIGCHACESACSEKNDLPAHLAFRSVGYVEGGSWPSYTRLNISMACNHCDDPVCLKGCPTNAYTKFAEYGAVLQDPDICFGCGYCTWVCPYNAPQLDPVKGEVEKCNMCVDRLEVGLKPACVAACLAGALDFGVIETVPENRTQKLLTIPGFPDPSISHPNIRFQQTRSLPNELTRTDSNLIRYERDSESKQFVPKVNRAASVLREWNLRKLNSRENPLVIFTLLSQMSVGLYVLHTLAQTLGALPAMSFSFSLWLLPVAVLFQGVGLLISTVHLGKPWRFYRGFYNLRHSPVSREAAALMLFFCCLGLETVLQMILAFFDTWGLDTVLTGLEWVGSVAGLTAIYFMNRIYRIPARPFWNHWWVLASFFGTMLSLGGLGLGLLGVVYGLVFGLDLVFGLTQIAAVAILVGLVLEGLGLVVHPRAMRVRGGEGEASSYLQSTMYGKTYWMRNMGLILSFALALVFVLTTFTPAFNLTSTVNITSVLTLTGWGCLAVILGATQIVGRALFYVLVIPTTMPGAFFWKNKSFEEHARKTGLANWKQTGVVADGH